MKRILLLIKCCSIFIINALSQNDGNWEVYMAGYDKGPGSVILDMSLIKTAPDNRYPFILITGVKFNDCDSAGFPSKKEFEALYRISDSVKALVKNTVLHKMAGTFTYQCERLDYYYITDTNSVREKLKELYNRSFKKYQPYITIKPDKNWDAFLQFLYPNEEIMEDISNQKVVMQLVNAGDKLDKPRQVDHWLYFLTEEGRKKFIAFAEKNKFHVEKTDFLKDNQLPYQLKISRVDLVNIAAINKITLLIKREAIKYNGNYDGWETFVIKE